MSSHCGICFGQGHSEENCGSKKKTASADSAAKNLSLARTYARLAAEYYETYIKVASGKNAKWTMAELLITARFFAFRAIGKQPCEERSPSVMLKCMLVRGHDGKHSTYDGFEW